MKCATCAYPQALCLAVYCKKDPELRDLPRAAGTPLIQAQAPAWCPLATPPPPSPCA